MHQTKHIDSRRQVKWIASAVTERRSSQCCWMRNMCVTCKLNLFPGKYLKLLAEIVFTIKGLRRKRQKKTVGSSLDVCFSSYAPCVRIATTVVVWDKCWPLSKYLWIYSIVVPPPFSCQRCCCLDQSQTAILVQLFEKQRRGSESGCLIKADRDFRQMHTRSGDV